MNPKTVILLICVYAVNVESSEFFSFKNLKSYAKIFHVDGALRNETGNELWDGLFRDCDPSVTFSCIQRNAYSYLDNVFVDKENITVFDGLVLKKNSLDYGSCSRKEDRDPLDENLVESSGDGCTEDESEETGRGLNEEQSPLEEVTNAIGKKAVKFLATRDYEIQLPEFFFEGAAMKISPKEVDESGALIRVDFGQRALESQGRIFKKISMFR